MIISIDELGKANTDWVKSGEVGYSSVPRNEWGGPGWGRVAIKAARIVLGHSVESVSGSGCQPCTATFVVKGAKH